MVRKMKNATNVAEKKTKKTKKRKKTGSSKEKTGTPCSEKENIQT